MNTTGIVRKVDDLGRIVLPAEMRRLLELDKSDVEIFLDGSKVVIRKYSPNCIFCGGRENLIQLEGKFVCAQCVAMLNNAAL